MNDSGYDALAKAIREATDLVPESECTLALKGGPFDGLMVPAVGRVCKVIGPPRKTEHLYDFTTGRYLGVAGSCG